MPIVICLDITCAHLIQAGCRYKHSVLYPWLIELLKHLFKRCDLAQNAVKDFLDIEKNFGKNKPRWSAGDQKHYGDTIGKLHKKVDEQLSKLRDITHDIYERIEWFKNLKEWVSIVTHLSIPVNLTISPFTRLQVSSLFKMLDDQSSFQNPQG